MISYAESLIVCNSALRDLKGIGCFCCHLPKRRACSRCVWKCMWAGKRFLWEPT